MSDRLESWKEIAAYLERDVRTVRRWEKNEGLPVRRHFHRQRSTVFALPSDIDDWLAERSPEVVQNSQPKGLAALFKSRKLFGGTAIGAGLFLLLVTPGWMKPDWLFTGKSAPPPLTKLSITLSETTLLKPTGTIGLAVSPDGRSAVYLGSHGGLTQLYLRPLDETEAVPIPGTEGAAGFPFFSPDGQSLGFFAEGKLKRVSLNGGPPVTLCEAGVRWAGGAWNSGGLIVYSAGPKRSGASLYRISASGGKPEILSSPDPEKSERTYTCPKFLPGGKELLFDVVADKRQGIRVLSLETGEQRVVVERGINGYYTAKGRLIYQEQATLKAAPFDLARLEVTGKAVPVLDEDIRGVDYSLSPNGTLLYVPKSGPATFTVAWVDREGAEKVISGPRPFFRSGRISPNGKQLAIAVQEGRGIHMRLYDLASDSLRLLTPLGRWNSHPVWSPDGRWITFVSYSKMNGPHDLYRQQVDGGSPAELLATRPSGAFPSSWSPDGNALAIQEQLSGNLNISILTRADDPIPRPFLSSPKRERSSQFSPDGKWIAFFSDEIETGLDSLYVRAYPESDVSWLVLGTQNAPRSQAVWSPDGNELFVYDGKKMLAVSLQTEPKFKVSKPRILFEASYSSGFDISPDGQRFLTMKKEIKATPIHVVLNWFQELERLVPTDNSG